MGGNHFTDQAWPRHTEYPAKQGMTMTFDKIHKVLGEGNFILVASEGTLGGRSTYFYDLCRVENGQVAEHWDTIDTIPPKQEWSNNDGKF